MYKKQRSLNFFEKCEINEIKRDRVIEEREREIY